MYKLNKYCVYAPYVNSIIVGWVCIGSDRVSYYENNKKTIHADGDVWVTIRTKELIIYYVYGEMREISSIDTTQPQFDIRRRKDGSMVKAYMIPNMKVIFEYNKSGNLEIYEVQTPWCVEITKFRNGIKCFYSKHLQYSIKYNEYGLPDKRTDKWHYIFE